MKTILKKWFQQNLLQNENTNSDFVKFYDEKRVLSISEVNDL